MEIWKDIEGYEGYQVSNEGRVRSLDRLVKDRNNSKRLKKGRVLKPQKNNVGYLQVYFNDNGKQVWKKVHRLVAEAFIENPQNYKEINHKDENKENNCVENLEWCSRKYNINYSLSKRVDQIDMITGEVVRQWESTAECGRNGYDYSAVAHCARGELKQYKGYVWKYLQA